MVRMMKRLEITRPNLKKSFQQTYSPAIRLAIVSLLICGLLFPIIVTGFAQVIFPYQANGSLVQLHNRNVGSDLIAQKFEKPFFFQPRNDSASGVDPHITLSDAYSQIPRVSNATRGQVTASDLKSLVDKNVEGTWWIFGSPYVNVLRLNRSLVEKYPSVYSAY